MALGVAGEQRELADKVLDIVEDEREAAVELLEALRIGQGLLSERLGKRARSLVARRPQQVEILPVERAAKLGGGKDDEPDQALLMEQGNARPELIVIDHPLRRGQRLLGRASPMVAERLEFNDPVTPLDFAPQAARF